METAVYLLLIALAMALGLGAALMPQGIETRTLRSDFDDLTDAELLERERQRERDTQIIATYEKDFDE